MHEISFKNISIIKSSNLDDTRNDVSTQGKTKKSNDTTNKSKSKSTNEVKMPPFYPASTQLQTKNNSWKKSIAQNNMIPFENERQTLFSTWTPLSDEKSNRKVKIKLIIHFLFDFF
jgi:hypothetical protein